MMISGKKCRNDHHRHLWYVSEIPHGRLNRECDAWKLSCTESSGSTEATGTSVGIVSPRRRWHQLRLMRPERTAIARISCASWVPTSDFLLPSIIRSICLCREWQTSDKVLETDGFCVCDAAQSFLGLGKGTHVLYSTSNKRSIL